MEKKEEMKWAGNLREEVMEVDKLLCESEIKDSVVNTHTVGCTQFLTIYCC